MLEQRQLETCLSPELLHLHDLKGKIAVVTDVLRATSCMVAGLSNGISRIVPVIGPEACKPYISQGYRSAGEHGGIKYPEFDMGNSPFDYLEPACTGQSVVMTTTNGTKALRMAQDGGANAVVAGAFLNLGALAEWLRNRPEDLVLVCAGWKGKFSMEDTLFAGALASCLSDTHAYACDATLGAVWLFEQNGNHLGDTLLSTSHAERLKGLGIADDIAYCAQCSLFQVVPILQADAMINALAKDIEEK